MLAQERWSWYCYNQTIRIKLNTFGRSDQVRELKSFPIIIRVVLFLLFIVSTFNYLYLRHRSMVLYLIYFVASVTEI